ncbi:MAG TPA: tetratricopeptide repeat protein [Cyclobacteriaceae bacterium]|nr:tetratricopeptide repeat protein [Cyclobacteriaceae bacterium]HRE68126.1 tetratricopeptide repeat protein [Cyclobacteriaceae bacterium]
MRASVFCFIFLLVLVSCSVEQNNVTSNVYHNVTAHYNGYYYAREKTREVEKLITRSLDDDPNQILRLFPKLDSTLAKSYVKDTEEIIKMASLSIQRHPNSKWVDDSYVLVGKARLYGYDFQNAIQTFKYVNTKSHDTDTRHRALVQLLRTFTEQQDYDRAEETFRFLEKEKLSKQNAKDLYLEKAYYYQERNDYDYMVRNLALADSLLEKSDRKGRIYFLIGQVYQKLGFDAEAFNYYRKCIGTNPDYEIDFYARLNLAQVARLDDRRDIKQLRAQFEKMLADTKNTEFRDKIYYELGEFDRKQGNLKEAIESYSLAAHAGNNKRIQGSAYLRIGQLQFDSLKKYSQAKLYYDSAIGALPKDFENYEAIKKRQEVLGEFAKYTEAITWNDSLLMLASVDTALLRKQIDSVLAERAKPVASVKKKKRRSYSGESSSSSSSAFFNTDNSNSVDWYFGNPSAIALGQSEFQRVWGVIPLEDNWRRSIKTTVLQETNTTIADVPQPDKPDTEAAAQPQKADEAGKLISQIPRTEADKAKALAQIEEGYFKLGDLFYFQLNEKNNASESYTKLLNRFPQSEYVPEVLYKLYLIAKDTDPAKAEVYAAELKTNHPRSTFTRILINPDYMRETSVAAEKQKLIYKEAYTYFQANNLRPAQEKLKQALQEGETSFTPQLELLQILITGKTEDVTRYQFELGEYIKKYPDGELKPYAEQLQAASKTLLDKLERAKGIQFIKSMEGPHNFIVVYSTSDKITNPVSSAIEKFNATQFKDQKLTTTNIIFNEEKTITIVSELPSQNVALSYFDKFLAQIAPGKPFSNYKFYSFVITKDNFQIFYRTKALDEYLAFFDRNYQKQNQ